MGITYKIKPGDNLSNIASRYGTTVHALQKANGISNPNVIYAGSNITIPDAVSSSADKVETNPKSYTYTPFEYDDYTESDVVKGLGDKKTDAENAVANYGDFAWSDQGKYDQLIQDYENRGKFSYDFNADALYQQYKDKYIQQGKMAMADTMGQAAAMTGGYGNSYAQTVGQQQYQASLDKLNDVIPELYQLAYEKHNQEGRDMLNMIGLMGDERAFAYGQWGDKYNQLVADRGYFGSQYASERGFDYDKYTADRGLAQNEHYTSEGAKYDAIRDAIADEQWQKNYNLSERELKMAEEAWELEKQAYNDANKGGNNPVNNTKKEDTKKEDKEPKVQAKKTTATTKFIGNHQTVNEWSRRGKSTSSYKAYIEGEINKIEDSLSDEELMYLIQYYGLS